MTGHDDTLTRRAVGCTPSQLHFDAARHRYTFRDRELVSVTQALDEAGLIDASWFTSESAMRGTRVHAAIELLHDGAIKGDDFPPDIAPYVAAYLKFGREGDFVVDAAEERLCDPVIGCAGTLDLRGHFGDARGRVDLIDIKTGSAPPWVGAQVAGYKLMLPPELSRTARRWALLLRDDGTYRLDPLTKRSDETVFLAALTIAQYRRGLL